MTVSSPGLVGRDRPELGRAFIAGVLRKALPVIVALWVFSGGFVIVEPSPYEVMFLAAFGLALIGGLRLSRGTLPVLYVTLAFTPFAIIAVFQMRYQSVTDGLIYNLVTIFLFVTTYFAANFVAQAPYRHMRLIAHSYVVVAIIASCVGTLAYLGLLPGEGVFLLYGRAKAFFKDPNVYGPFLMLPAMFVLQRALLGQGKSVAWNGLAYLVIFIGVFVSFSRGAWGHLAASSAMLFFLIFFLESSGRDKVRLLLFAVGGTMVLAAALAALLSIPAVADLFVHRFSLTQSYDTGETGRFGRIWYTIEVALLNPLGIGPLEYGYMRIEEQPHNTYLNVPLSYGWGGALAYYSLVVWTTVVGLTCLARRSVNRTLLIPVFATFLPMLILSGIIDTDHWRHWFLVAGLVWGVCAGYRVVDPAQLRLRRSLP
ncbi:O-antigen ligase family protein [Pelagibacterium luteolum]|uniref:O-antigen ligase like membrane protein n=1 Tax=Pelagibacterium luteolum TaxID=440168 RepID=A0A1G7WH74_9HYPH|nr:hypothetical protein [Pelagibacterium luteolum]SDG70570.1 hypothetical protein SAMN04487974_106115 [Pelagibacterium luteolum]